MNKVLAVLGVSALALMGCDSRDANAQSQVSADVGNPDSANVLVVQEGYEVITPAAPADNNMAPDPENPGVDVAPAGSNAKSPNVSTPNNMPSGNAAAPVQGNNRVIVDENVTGTVSPDGVAYQVDETVN